MEEAKSLKLTIRIQEKQIADLNKRLKLKEEV